MHIVRYADDVRILCATKTQANRVMEAMPLMTENLRKMAKRPQLIKKLV